MNKKIMGYFGRFTLVHLLVYWIIGSLFYQISGYEEALATMEVFQHWRPLESIVMVCVVFFGQIARGALLALLIYPFYQVFMKKKHGWVLLFGLLFGLKVLGSPIFIHEFIISTSALGSITEFLQSLIIGIPEIMAQTLIFSLLFFVWESSTLKKEIIQENIYDKNLGHASVTCRSGTKHVLQSKNRR